MWCSSNHIPALEKAKKLCEDALQCFKPEVPCSVDVLDELAQTLRECDSMLEELRRIELVDDSHAKKEVKKGVKKGMKKDVKKGTDEGEKKDVKKGTDEGEKKEDVKKGMDEGEKKDVKKGEEEKEVVEEKEKKEEKEEDEAFFDKSAVINYKLSKECSDFLPGVTSFDERYDDTRTTHISVVPLAAKEAKFFFHNLRMHQGSKFRRIGRDLGVSVSVQRVGDPIPRDESLRYSSFHVAARSWTLRPIPLRDGEISAYRARFRHF